jgi:hypothetical protein
MLVKEESWTVTNLKQDNLTVVATCAGNGNYQVQNSPAPLRAFCDGQV